MLFLTITFIFSLYKIIKWHYDNKLIEKETKNIKKIIKIKPKEEDPNYLNIDLPLLIKQNKDTIGWIQVNGTNINYPFVQTTNNEYYLNHSFNKSYTDAGWIFLDYRNDINNLKYNTIIYGHARKDKTMFGSLKNVLNKDWYNNQNNHIIKTSTLKENSLWQIFSIYHTPTNVSYIQTEFNSKNEFKDFVNDIISKSIYNFNININENDKILTLSTCYKTNEKLVVHAKLIKNSIK